MIAKTFAHRLGAAMSCIIVCALGTSAATAPAGYFDEGELLADSLIADRPSSGELSQGPSLVTIEYVYVGQELLPQLKVATASERHLLRGLVSVSDHNDARMDFPAIEGVITGVNGRAFRIQGGIETPIDPNSKEGRAILDEINRPCICAPVPEDMNAWY